MYYANHRAYAKNVNLFLIDTINNNKEVILTNIDMLRLLYELT